jgi:hypothetical protein
MDMTFWLPESEPTLAAGGMVVMNDDTLLLPCGAGYGNYREADAGVLIIMSDIMTASTPLDET